MTRNSSPRVVAIGLAIPAVLVTTLGGGAAWAGHRAEPDAWTITGHGYGHGHGLSQYGAQGAALQGKSWRDIVGFYYPGTEVATTHGKIRVQISADTTDDVQVKATPGLKVRDLGTGTSTTLPANGARRWRLTADADGNTAVQYRLKHRWHRFDIADASTLHGDGQFMAPTPLTLVLPDGSTASYRGALRSSPTAPGASSRDTVNVLSMDDYVRGVVASEMPSSWEPAALKSQTVAARTYAAYEREQNLDGSYQICDTTACQVYTGTAAETESTDQAVAGTSRQIVTSDGAPAFTQFSSSDGGWTSSGGVSYLPAQADPYDGWSGNTVNTWSVRISAGDLEAAYPQIGSPRRVLVKQRDGNGDWGGRVETVSLLGSDGHVTVSSDDLRLALGLRSNWFEIQPSGH